MDNATSISLMIGYFIIVGFTCYTISYITKNRKKFGTDLIAFLNSAIIFSGTLIYSTFFILSIVFHFSEEINITLWKLSIIFELISLIITTFIYSFFREYHKIQILPVAYIVLLFGLIVGLLFRENSIQLNTTISDPIPFIFPDLSLVNFQYDLFTGTLIIVAEISLIFYLAYISLLILRNTKSLDDSLPLFLNTIISAFPIIMYILYIIMQRPLLRELHITLLWIASLAMNIMLIKKPEMFFVLPNKILSINIYHKSGILLYSYNFGEYNHQRIDSTIWGNILIGLNHILGEFIDVEDKIDVIKTKNSDVVVKYEIEAGYAMVVITNKKNKIIENLMEPFSEEFKNKFKKELDDIQDLNRIINVSDFIDTKGIIKDHFQLYL
ncbi:MAG: hypothetical protein KGD73_07110 [Candidatus Lokiarchaeota archaeon]|nr:hypothetical protein [Candidatus Lokiarchaeota archaeon]